MLKVVNFIKLLSIVLFLIILTLVYAYLPVMVQMDPDNELQIQKEDFFYYSVAIFTIVNLFLLGFQRIIEPILRGEDLKGWVRGLAFVINCYFTLLIGFIGIINNQGHLTLSGFAYLNYLGPFLVFSWIIGLIYLLLKQKKTA